jgi:hypothetical protein
LSGFEAIVPNLARGTTEESTRVLRRRQAVAEVADVGQRETTRDII